MVMGHSILRLKINPAQEHGLRFGHPGYKPLLTLGLLLIILMYHPISAQGHIE